MVQVLASLHPILAQMEGYESHGGGGAAAMVMMLFELAILVVTVAGSWKVFTKAGQPGWAAIIPIYNAVVLLQIIRKPIWWILLLLIPFVNFIVAILCMVELAKAFGKGIGFAVGLILLGPIFICILGFGDAQYGGGAPAGAMPSPAR